MNEVKLHVEDQDKIDFENGRHEKIEDGETLQSSISICSANSLFIIVFSPFVYIIPSNHLVSSYLGQHLLASVLSIDSFYTSSFVLLSL